MDIAQKIDVPNSPVRNLSKDYLRFVNTHQFSPAANEFLKNKAKGKPCYISAPAEHKEYDDYWNEQERRCKEGYEIGGVRITGRHYFYLNFTQIRARSFNYETKQESARKIITFPRFLDMDYYFFHELEECMAEGEFEGNDRKGMIVAKARRKGFTFKMSGGVFAYNFSFIPYSMNIVGAYEKVHYREILDGIHFALNHQNKYTDFGKSRQRLDRRDHFRASFLEKTEDGNYIEQGYMSEVMAVSFMDNPFKAIGASAEVFGFEEAGKFPNLLETYAITEPLFRDGSIMTGVPLLWGTGGDISKGGADFAEMFYNPSAYGLKAYENIYDESASSDCGYFVDDLWYSPGAKKKSGNKIITSFDEHGNSNREIAFETLKQKRQLWKKGSNVSYNKNISQQPLTPREAFLRVQGTVFDVERAAQRVSYLNTNRKVLNAIQRGSMTVDESGDIIFNKKHDAIPLTEFPIRNNDQPGCIEIYEHPARNSEGEIMPGRYIAGIDTYDDDKSTTQSVGSCIVFDLATDRIVAHYKGRPDANVFYENCRKLLKYYNALGCYERNKKGFYGHFYNRNCLHYLADEPTILKEKGISKSNNYGNNRKGIHVAGNDKVDGVKSMGINLIKDWLEAKAYGEDEESETTNLDKIVSLPLLKEIESWHPPPGGNFDDISAMIMLMILREDKRGIKVEERTETNLDRYERDKFFLGNILGQKVYYDQTISKTETSVYKEERELANRVR